MKNISTGATLLSFASILLMLILVPAYGDQGTTAGGVKIEDKPLDKDHVEKDENAEPGTDNVTDYKNPKPTPNVPNHYHVTICEGERLGPWNPWGKQGGQGRPAGTSTDTPPPAPGAKPTTPHATAGHDPNDSGSTPTGDVQIVGHSPGDSDCTLNLMDGKKVIATVVISVHVIVCSGAHDPDPRKTGNQFLHPRGHISLDGGSGDSGGSGQINLIPPISVVPPLTDTPPTDQKKTDKTVTTSDTPGDTLTDTTEATGGQPGVFGGDATVTAPEKQYPLTDKPL